MNIIKEINNLLGKIQEELHESEVEFKLNIWTDKGKAHKIKDKLLSDTEGYCDDICEHFDNEDWISIQIGSLDISIWHNLN